MPESKAFIIVATTDSDRFDPLAFKTAIESIANDVSLCMTGKDMLAMFCYTTSRAFFINNVIARANVPGLLYFAVMELGRDWFAPDQLPCSKWLTAHVGAWRR